MTLLDLKTINKYDKSKMYSAYDQWPKFAKDSYNSSYDPAGFTNIKEIIFVGMGGSGTIGDIFSSILSKTKISVSVVKGFNLPNTINSESLVVLTSISGNTPETLSVLHSIKELDCKTIAFSSGGKLEEYCKINNLQHRLVPQIHSPRASLLSYLFSMIKVLESIMKAHIGESQKPIRPEFSAKLSMPNYIDTKNPESILVQLVNNNSLIIDDLEIFIKRN